MLHRLRITEYALIDDVEIEFGPGLNVLTGETGAGKSILVGSLALLLGARASSDVVREGSDEATVEGVFGGDGGETLIQRQVRLDRSNRCLVDGSLATVRMLQEEGERRVELHGQNEDQRLLRPSTQRDLLDGFAGTRELAGSVRELADTVTGIDREREALEAESDERIARIEYLRSQIEEIEGAELDPAEEAALEAEAGRLRHSEERQRLSEELRVGLEGDEIGVSGGLASLQKLIERLAELDPDMRSWADRLNEVRYEIEDISRHMSGYADGIEHDPGRLSEIEERRDLLFRLRRKHGSTLQDVIDKARSYREELKGLESSIQRERNLESERAEAMIRLEDAAAALADARQAAADRLEVAVRDRLTALGMGNGRLDVDLVRSEDPGGIAWGGGRFSWTRSGLEEVRFRITPNAGEPSKLLSRVASGGELSRILLAIKAALAEVDRTPTLVFDEIDAGIGGVVAHHVARQLEDVASHHQVIVVTHLAQIAAAADRHLVVEKSTVGGRTVTEVRAVTSDDRVAEISRLLGGDPDRDVSIDHARELLAGSR